MRRHAPRAHTPRARAHAVAHEPADTPPTRPPTSPCRAPPAPRLVRRSHRTEDHPLGIIKFKIEEYFNSLEGQNFEIVDNLEPFVNGKARVEPLPCDPHAHRRPLYHRVFVSHNTPRHATRCVAHLSQECFDDLLIPTDHPGRLPSDTYYISRPGGKAVSSSEDRLMRTHTSAHQSTLLKEVQRPA